MASAVTTPPPLPTYWPVGITSFESPVSFPVTEFTLEYAAAKIAHLNPDFKLDPTELAQMRSFLQTQAAQAVGPKWHNWILPAYQWSLLVTAPALACLLRPSLVHTHYFLLYAAIAVVFGFVAFALTNILVVPLISFFTEAIKPGWIPEAPYQVAQISAFYLLWLWLAHKLSITVALPMWTVWPLLSGVLAQLIRPLPVLLTVLWNVANARRNQGAHARAPEAFIGQLLFEVFAEAALCTSTPIPLSTRKQWVGYLTNAATCLDTSLPRQFLSGDASVAGQIATELKKRAAAIRELAATVAISGESALELATRTRPLVRCACYLDWGALPAAEPGTVQEKARIRVWLGKAVRSLITLAIPLSIEFALYRRWIVLDASQQSWANAILLLWMGLIILSLVDPDYEFTNKTLDTVNKIPMFGKMGKRE